MTFENHGTLNEQIFFTLIINLVSLFYMQYHGQYYGFWKPWAHEDKAALGE